MVEIFRPSRCFCAPAPFALAFLDEWVARSSATISTIFPFRKTYTGVFVANPHCLAFHAARLSATPTLARSGSLMDVRLLAISGKHLSIREINIEAVFFGFNRCLGFDLSQKVSIGRAFHNHTLCGNRQRYIQ